ncbi:YihY/virulence factor BrkB family protein [Ruicaihuangia caeni]|uniref:YihY/virulence factor BrkB family protein n=1 Tax=Ruicaihuangia caeni TaxID=3042517 RepID=UPI00338EBA60
MGDERGLLQKAKKRLELLMQKRPVRAWQRYSTSRGPLLAAGLTFRGLFAVFAAVWVAFSIIGLVLVGNDELLDALIESVNGFIPGLIDSGSGGVIDPNTLQVGVTLSWTGAIALGGLVFTAVGWLGAARGAVRIIFDYPPAEVNFALLKLRDLGFGIALGALVLVSAALSVVSMQLFGGLAELVGLDRDSAVVTLVLRAAGLVLMAAIDVFALCVLFRFVSVLRIPFKALIGGALIGAIGLGALKLAAGLLLARTGNNPLLASFAVLLGLLLWINLACQVVLIAAAWIAETLEDRGVIADPAVAQAERERQRREREKIARQARRLVPRWLRWAVREPKAAPSQRPGRSPSDVAGDP